MRWQSENIQCRTVQNQNAYTRTEENQQNIIADLSDKKRNVLYLGKRARWQGVLELGEIADVGTR